jgi:DNA-binding transcriptional MocR family regulator
MPAEVSPLERFEQCKAKNLSLNMSRGQPAPEQLDLSLGLLTVLGAQDFLSRDGLDCRNYPGGVCGLPEAREMFSKLLEVPAQQTLVGNNASIEIMQDILVWGMLKGLPGGNGPWFGKAKFLCPAPGYDRHFFMLEALGIEMIPVGMTDAGPDMEEVARLAAADEAIKGIWCVPRYSNPTGVTFSAEVVDALASMKTAAGDFRIFWDNAYAIHHLVDNPKPLKNLYAACEAAGNPDRPLLFSSTSKITFAGGGVGFLGASKTNMAFFEKHFGTQTIGPEKINQLRHVRFLENYPGGIEALMAAHAKLLKPKFDAVLETFERELGGTGLATWNRPEGGYFINFDTLPGMAKRVVNLAAEAGVVMTAAGSSFPYGKDPRDTNIRVAPSRPSLNEVRQAAEVLAICVKLAGSEAGK